MAHWRRLADGKEALLTQLLQEILSVSSGLKNMLPPGANLKVVSVLRGRPCTVRALRTTLLLDWTPPKEPPGTLLMSLKLGDPNYPSSRQLQATFPSHKTSCKMGAFGGAIGSASGSRDGG